MDRNSYLSQLTSDLDTTFARSKERVQESRMNWANNRAVSNFSAQMKEMVFPVLYSSGKGSWFTDIDGNELLDMSMGFGVHLFGLNPDFIQEAVKSVMQDGVILGPLHERTAAVAEKLCEMTHSDRCAFYNTGTEAVMVSMRLARAKTKRKKIAVFEGAYHGTHDSLLAYKSDRYTHQAIAQVPGVTQEILDNTLLLHFDESCLAVIDDHRDELAGVLLEPVRSRFPDEVSKTVIQGLRQRCDAYGITLIFDEVITGFRYANRGVVEFFEVTPDLSTYGKVLGGGFPIGVVCGKHEWMDYVDGGFWAYGDDSAPPSTMTFTAGTFNHYPVSMLAAETVLDVLKKSGGQLQKELNEQTKVMCTELNQFFDKQGINLRVVHFGSLFRFKLRGNQKILFYALLREKVFIWEGRNCFLSTAHNAADRAYFVEKVKKCCVELHEVGILN